MMTDIQYLLGKLAEESAELAQIAIKAQQFGIDEVYDGNGNPEKLSNRDRVEIEFNDVMAVLNLLHTEHGVVVHAMPSMQDKKCTKLRKWREYSRKLKMVEP